MKKMILIIGGFLLFVCVFGAVLYGLFYFHLIPGKSYSAADFGIKTLKSQTDYDGDGIDDYTDILLGARAYIETKPVFKSKCYVGGYPPDGEGVSADIVWKAFQNAGYSLKDLVDQDISENTKAYPGVNETPNPDIDFRRVRNLLAFFRRHAEPLTTDLQNIGEWQPGDIVIFSVDDIGIVSDKRNKNGVPYLLHNSGQPVLEEDAMTKYETIVGHFRWNYSYYENSLTG